MMLDTGAYMTLDAWSINEDINIRVIFRDNTCDITCIDFCRKILV